MGDAKDDDTPFFVWFNTTHMHFRTHIKDGSRGKAGRWQSEYHDVMFDHDELVGQILDYLDELGLADDTIVMYSTDNGPHMNTLARRRHDAVPQREELQLGGRLPRAGDGALARPHPGRSGAQRHRQPQRLVRDAAGRGRRPRHRRASSRPGTELDGTTYKVHLDGYNQLDYLTGAADESPRQHFFYVSDDGDLTALRYDNWKIVFLEQRATGTLQVWAEPFTELRVPKIFNLRTDPYERADITSNTYYDWMLDHVWVFVPAQMYVGEDAADARRVPAAPGAGQLQHRQGAGEAAGRRRRAA